MSTRQNTLIQDIILLAKYHYGPYISASSFENAFGLVIEYHRFIDPAHKEILEPKYLIGIFIEAMDCLTDGAWREGPMLERKLAELFSNNGPLAVNMLSAFALTEVKAGVVLTPDPVLKEQIERSRDA